MKKIVISLLLTVFLGPGIGHIYLRRIREGITLFMTGLLVAYVFSPLIARSAPEGDFTRVELLTSFAAKYPDAANLFNIVFSALWAYTLVSVYRYARSAAANGRKERAGERHGEDHG